MGIRFSRKRDSAPISDETAASDQKSPEEATAAQPAEESEITESQGAAETEDLDVVVGGSTTPVVCLPNEECIAVFEEVEFLEDAEPGPVAKEAEPVIEETPAPVQPSHLVSDKSPSPLESGLVAGTKPVAEAQLEPEPVPEAEAPADPKAEAEAVSEPISESLPDPAETVERQIDMPTQERVPEPELCSLPLIDLGIPDLTPKPFNISASPDPISDPGTTDEPSNILVAEGCQDSAEAVESCRFELEKPEKTSESLEKPVEDEAFENLVQRVSKANEESITGLLQNLELKGNDLIPSDVKIPDDTPITDISTSTELI